MISKVFLTCLDWLKDHSYQISAQLEHFVSNRKWRHYEPLVTLNDLKSIFNMFRMPYGFSISNFIPIGPCWKFDIWPINFDLWGHKHHRCTVHRMFYQISYDEPGRSSRCRDIADFVHFTLFLQVPEMTLDDLWTHVCVNWDNTGKWSFIWPNDINVLYCT